jgi:DNA-binding CsgD family transcriptional regulator
MLAIARLRAGEVDAARELLTRALRDAEELDSGRWLLANAVEAAADQLGTVGQAYKAVICWTAVDEARAASRDRGFGTETTIFEAARDRDESALTPAAFAAASATGRQMSLKDTVAFAIETLEEEAASDARMHPVRRGRYDFTPREWEVLELVAAGRSDGEIADALFISKKTASVHVGNIKGKLGATSRVEIVTIALSQGLVPSPVPNVERSRPIG